MVKMRDEPSSDGSVGEMVFHHAKFALGTFFPSIKLDLLAFYCLEFTVMRLVPVYVSDNTGVFKVYNGVVNKKLGGGRRVEDVEVVILDPRTVEVGRRVCVCMKGDGVLGISPLANPYKVSVNSDLPKGNVSCYLVLSILIEEDKRVLLRITAVVLTPSSSWMVRVVKLFSKLGNVGNGARGRGKGDSGVIHGEPDWFVVLNIFIRHVTFNFVEDLRDEKKVFNGGIVTEGSGEDLVVKLSVP